MAERPENAPAPETPCEECDEPMGNSWGVTQINEFIADRDTDKKHAEIGVLFEYLPIHSACWWARKNANA